MWRTSFFYLFFICILTTSSFAMFNNSFDQDDPLLEEAQEPPKQKTKTRIVTVKPVKVACMRCRKLKIRCTETTPCKSCDRIGKTCVKNSVANDGRYGKEESHKKNSKTVKDTAIKTACASCKTLKIACGDDVLCEQCEKRGLWCIKERNESAIPDNKQMSSPQNLTWQFVHEDRMDDHEGFTKGDNGQFSLYPELDKIFSE